MPCMWWRCSWCPRRTGCLLSGAGTARTTFRACAACCGRWRRSRCDARWCCQSGRRRSPARAPRSRPGERFVGKNINGEKKGNQNKTKQNKMKIKRCTANARACEWAQRRRAPAGQSGPSGRPWAQPCPAPSATAPSPSRTGGDEKLKNGRATWSTAIFPRCNTVAFIKSQCGYMQQSSPSPCFASGLWARSSVWQCWQCRWQIRPPFQKEKKRAVSSQKGERK